MLPTKQRQPEYYFELLTFNNTETNNTETKEGHTLWHLARIFHCKFGYAVYHTFLKKWQGSALCGNEVLPSMT